MKLSDRRSFLATSAGLVLAGGSALATPQLPRAVRVAQIGTRHAHASGKMATFRKYPDIFEVVGYAEPDPQQLDRVRSQAAYDGLPVLPVDRLLATKDLDIVAVETDIDQLLPTAERCIQAGCHIHLDKPAGTSLPHFRRICQQADAAGLAIQLGYMFRGNPAFRYLFDAVNAGWLGDVFHIHCEMSKKIPASARAGLARFPGGSMFELGCHLIDAVVRILGAPASVTPFLKKTQPERDSLNDNCLAVFDYPGATASIRSSVVEYNGGRRRQFVVCGSQGTIVIRPLEPFHLTISLEQPAGDLPRGTHEVKLDAAGGRYDYNLLHLAAVAAGTEPQQYKRDHDLAVQKAVLQASGMPVE